ncbi:uncharacterized protein LOC123523823 [Mercenaria mercenaria]|uniref:uncharacterized protein LOC123523823 n=1 Tax=Mercenaria mercenaria TaxID=6596 RepID=UPI00234EA961|nr:uncharacterized protein LOC123523823 [Mercenaria mercenaria]
MQGLLARLKTVRDQNSDSDVPQRDGIQGIKNHFTLNKFINHAEPNDAGNKIIPNGTKIDNIYDLESELDTARTDDDVEIEIVMAMNKTTGRVRNRSSTSSPRQIVKSTKSRGGSRVSLNSVALSEKDDLDTLNLDSDDERLTPQKSEKYPPSQAWAAFENCVKNIDNSSPEYFVKKPKPNFVSSGTFQKVMVDMYGNCEYGNTKGYTLLKQKLNNMARSTMLASRMMQAAVEKGQEERENEENHDGESVEEALQESTAEPESVAKTFAKRGWKILKREVNETAMEQKIQSTKLNWTMLQHTLKQMSNVERTRQDLYERYGIVPTTLPDGTTVCENRMLSERARAQLYGRNKDGNEYKRPLSYQPPPVHLRSRSQVGYQKKIRDGAKSAKLPSVGRGRQRPVTAKP